MSVTAEVIAQNLLSKETRRVAYLEPSGVFCKKDVLKDFAKFTRKDLCRILSFNERADLRHRCSPGNFLRIFKEHLII